MCPEGNKAGVRAEKKVLWGVAKDYGLNLVQRQGSWEVVVSSSLNEKLLLQNITKFKFLTVKFTFD